VTAAASSQIIAETERLAARYSPELNFLERGDSDADFEHDDYAKL
jgi:hypothetical protein